MRERNSESRWSKAELRQIEQGNLDTRPRHLVTKFVSTRKRGREADFAVEHTMTTTEILKWIAILSTTLVIVGYTILYTINYFKG